jgi:hypothetical protein
MAVAEKWQRLPPAPIQYTGMRSPLAITIESSFVAEDKDLATLIQHCIRDFPASRCAWQVPSIIAPLPKSMPRARLVGVAEKSASLAVALPPDAAPSGSASSSAVSSSAALPRPAPRATPIWDRNDLWKTLGRPCPPGSTQDAVAAPGVGRLWLTQR